MIIFSKSRSDLQSYFLEEVNKKVVHILKVSFDPSSDPGKLTGPKKEGLVSKTKAETRYFQEMSLVCTIFSFALQSLGIADF